jgi:LmbE family N-acetylglucosaminyl deacetylase
MRSVLFTPHADDESLFAAHLLTTDRPRVVICFGSERDYGATEVRTEESRRAVAVLGAGPVEQWDGGDLVAQMQALDAALGPDRVFAPALPASHPHHVAVAAAARAVFGDRLIGYHTYEAGTKVRLGRRVVFTGEAARLKRAALACYETQRTHPRANVFYDEAVFELDEYLDLPLAVESDPAVVAVAEGAIGAANDLLQDGVSSADEARANGADASADEPREQTPVVPPSEATAQSVPPLATRADKGPRKGKGGKGRW